MTLMLITPDGRRPRRGWVAVPGFPNAWMHWRKWKRHERKRKLADRAFARELFGLWRTKA